MKDLMFPRKMDLTSRQTLQYYILEYRNHTLTHLIIAADSASIFTIYLPALSSLRERVDDDELDGASDVEPERKRRYHTDSESDTHPNVSEESSLKVWKLNQKKRKGRLCCPMPTRMRHSRRNEASSAGHCPKERSPSPPQGRGGSASGLQCIRGCGGDPTPITYAWKEPAGKIQKNWAHSDARTQHPGQTS